jgi:carboxyl-terminal processing protease
MHRRTVALLGTTSLAAFAGGALCTHLAGAESHATDYKDLGVFARVLSYVQDNYVDEVDPNQLIYGAIKGMVGTLDPHSEFMTPAEYKQLEDDTSGTFGGIGLEVEERNRMLTVVSPIDGTPAARAGLKTGDQILAVDGTTTQGMDVNDAVTKMRGEVGTHVKLTVLHAQTQVQEDIDLVREQINVSSVDARVLDAPSGIGYLRIKQFAEHTDATLEDAVNQLEKDAGGNLNGLVVDLRNNPGGLLDQSVAVADEFLAQGTIVKTIGRGNRIIEEEEARPGGMLESVPVIVLVNGGSASAAEILAGALQDDGRALIMGTQTFGKGSVQSIIDLDDGSGLKLTIARYYTPSGRSIQELGITPDVVVQQMDPALLAKAVVSDAPLEREADLTNHLKNPNAPVGGAASASQPSSQPTQTDYQLDTAVDYLKSYRKLAAQPGATQLAR